MKIQITVETKHIVRLIAITLLALVIAQSKAIYDLQSAIAMYHDSTVQNTLTIDVYRYHTDVTENGIVLWTQYDIDHYPSQKCDSFDNNNSNGHTCVVGDKIENIAQDYGG